MKKWLFIFICIHLQSSQGFGQFAFDTIQLDANLVYNYTTSISFDYQHTQWISTLRGLYKIDGYDAKYFVFNPNDSLSICTNNVHEVFQDKDQMLWVLTGKGVQRFDPETETFHLVFKSYLEEKEEVNLYEKGFTCGMQIGDDRLLFGTKQGFIIYNKRTGAYQFNAIEDAPLVDGYSSSTHVVDVVDSQLGKNLFHLLTRGGIYQFDARNNQLQLLPNPDQIPFENISTPGLKMVRHQDELIFLCQRELFRYNLSTYQSQEISYKGFGEKPGLLRDIELQQDSILWISTVGRGIYKINLNSDSNQAALVVEGLYNKLAIDTLGYLWTIAETKYLLRSKDPLFVSKRMIPVLDWTEVWVNDVLIPKSKFTQPVDLQLKNFERRLRAKLTLRNPDPKEEVKFSYQLQPRDKDWIEMPASREIQFEDLAPGKYVLVGNVKEGKFSGKRSYLSISIDEYFYETWWFRGLVFLTIFFFLSSIYYLLAARRKDRESHQRDMLKIELDALRSQMNPHFLFNTLNSIKNYVLTKTPDEAADYLTSFSKLIRGILENSKQPFLTLEQELNALELYVEMEHLRFGKDFTYSFEIDENIHPSNFKLAPMLIQPFIENAIWHGLMNKRSDRQLLIRFNKVVNGILCEIIDNGIGRKAAGKLYADRSKKSLGLKITLDRINNINLIYGLDSKVEILNNQPSGTIVKILLPQINQ